jgi:hypothetical protein
LENRVRHDDGFWQRLTELVYWRLCEQGGDLVCPEHEPRHDAFADHDCENDDVVKAIPGGPPMDEAGDFRKGTVWLRRLFPISACPQQQCRTWTEGPSRQRRMPHHPKSMSSQVGLRHGFYAVRASPSLSSLIICWRIMNFWGLPVAVIGNSATKLM